MASPAYPPPPNEPPPDEYNPEALEDVEPGRFRNVDIEPKMATTSRTAAVAQPVVGGAPSSSETTTIGGEQKKTVLLGSFTSPFGYMNFKDQTALLAVFSLIVLVQSSLNCSNSSYATPYPCTEINAFAVAAGTVSLGLCIIYFLTETRTANDDKVRFAFSVLMFLWWAAAMIVLTFFGPFKTVYYANGYFGTWGAFFTATMMLAHTSEIFRKGIHKLATGVSHRPVMYLLIASLVEIGAAIDSCIPQTQCNGLNAFAISLGSVSAILCLILIPLMNRIGDQGMRNIAIFFCAWWVVGGMIVTFDAPFQTLGNGYFSVFAAIVSSFYLLQALQLE